MRTTLTLIGLVIKFNMQRDQTLVLCFPRQALTKILQRRKEGKNKQKHCRRSACLKNTTKIERAPSLKHFHISFEKVIKFYGLKTFKGCHANSHCCSMYMYPLRLDRPGVLLTFSLKPTKHSFGLVGFTCTSIA